MTISSSELLSLTLSGSLSNKSEAEDAETVGVADKGPKNLYIAGWLFRIGIALGGLPNILLV